jgi:cytoskeleton protein RodZ
MAGLGEEFRAAREARHLSLSDVSEQIHIRTIYLQSLEDEDWTAIAAPVYVRGFIRTYARFLGLPSEQAVAFFNDSVGTAATKNEHVVATQPRRRLSVWLWLAAAAAVALVAFVGYQYYEFQQGQPTDQAATHAKAPVAGSAAAPDASDTALPAAAKHPKVASTLEVRITQSSWLLVKIDGKQQLEGILPAGTTKKFHGSTATVRAGNAGGVHLEVNGKALGSMGPSGAVVDRTIRLAAAE